MEYGRPVTVDHGNARRLSWTAPPDRPHPVRPAMPPSGHDDEAAYAAVLEELRNGVRDEPLMAKAYAEAEGDENKARALYMRWRSAKLMESLRRGRRREYQQAAPPARWTRPAASRNRSWSKPRPYDFLLVIGLLLLLYLFNSDFHRAVLHLLRRLGLQQA